MDKLANFVLHRFVIVADLKLTSRLEHQASPLANLSLQPLLFDPAADAVEIGHQLDHAFLTERILLSEIVVRVIRATFRQD